MTPEHGAAGVAGPAPFVLPGPPPARETLAGWQQWRAARGAPAESSANIGAPDPAPLIESGR